MFKLIHKIAVGCLGLVVHNSNYPLLLVGQKNNNSVRDDLRLAPQGSLLGTGVRRAKLTGSYALTFRI